MRYGLPVNCSRDEWTSPEADASPKIFCSPMKRCIETANFLIQEKQSIVLTSELKEMSFGDFDGIPFNQYSQEDQNLLNSINQETDTLPGSLENYPLFKNRVLNFIDKILANAKENDHYLFITHGGVIACLIAMILKLPIKDIIYHMSASNRCFTQLKIYINMENESKFWEIKAFNNPKEPN